MREIELNGVKACKKQWINVFSLNLIQSRPAREKLQKRCSSMDQKNEEKIHEPSA